MKKVFWLIGLFAVAWLLTRCDEVDVTSEGDDTVEDMASYDANVKNDASVEPDESPPPDVVSDDNPPDAPTCNILPGYGPYEWVYCGDAADCCRMEWDMVKCTASCWIDPGIPPPLFSGAPMDIVISYMGCAPCL